MKLIFNIEPITHPLTGIGRYSLELVSRFLADPRLDDVALWRFGHRAPELPDFSESDSNAGGGSGFSALSFVKKQILKCPPAASLALGALNGLSRLRLNRLRGYVYHGPNFYLPPVNGPKVATVHDLSIISTPQCHPESRVALMRKCLDDVWKRADYVITISEFSKKEIVEKTPFPAEKIKVTLLAAGPDFRPRPPAETGPVLAHYGLSPGGYCLFTGTLEPRKNLETLLDAYEGLPEALRRRFPLAVAGHQGWKSERTRARLEKMAGRGWAVPLGFIPAAIQPHLTAGAALFLFPSLYEGFGLPPLEAMQAGVPTVVSHRASLPEVVGQAAACLPATDSSLWRDTILEILENEGLRTKMAARGLEQAARFSWDKCAEETLAVYRLAAEASF